MAATADNDGLIVGFELGRTPLFTPAPLAAQPFVQQRPSREFPHVETNLLS
jgi:hypothetical protein